MTPAQWLQVALRPRSYTCFRLGSLSVWNASPTLLKASSESRDLFLSGCTILEVRWYAFLTASGVTSSCPSWSTAYKSTAPMTRRVVASICFNASTIVSVSMLLTELCTILLLQDT